MYRISKPVDKVSVTKGSKEKKCTLNVLSNANTHRFGFSIISESILILWKSNNPALSQMTPVKSQVVFPCTNDSPHSQQTARCISLHQRCPAVGGRGAARDEEEEGDARKDEGMGMKDQEGLEVSGRHLYLQQGPGSTRDRGGLQGTFPPPHGAISGQKNQHCKSQTRLPKREEAECMCV